MGIQIKNNHTLTSEAHVNRSTLLESVRFQTTQLRRRLQIADNGSGLNEGGHQTAPRRSLAKSVENRGKFEGNRPREVEKLASS